MSFLTAAALAVGLLVVAPLVAHLLRRGRTPERVFPPAALVARIEAHSKERARLEDRTLLGFRMAMVLVLAVLGATPLVRCSRLSVDRPDGASVALALVIDDSHSMRAETPSGSTRWEAAIEGARQLLRSAREGDAVAIVLAGRPARLALSATTDLGAARAALDELRVSDRGTDLASALDLARAAIDGLSQPDHQLVALSDLAGAELSAQDAWAPLENLRKPTNDCGLVGARRDKERLSVILTCSKGASGPRQLRIGGADAAQILTEPNSMERLSLAPEHGTQTLAFGLRSDTPEATAEDAAAPELELLLTPPDENPSNDRVQVSRAGAGLGVAVVTDLTQASVITGGPTIIEQALAAVRPDVTVRPLSLLPHEARELQPFAALVINDPPGLGPESRLALSEWLERGGVALGLLGPASSALQLSSTLEPFAERAARWESSSNPLDVSPASLSWLGPEAHSLGGLTRTGRMRLDGAALPGTTVAATWADGLPFLTRRHVGAGLVLTAALPASVEHSDFALRPAFLALLDHLVNEAEQRRGPRLSSVGERWTFAAGTAVRIMGPAGPVALRPEGCDPEGEAPRGCTPGQLVATPDLAGRYTVIRDDRSRIHTVLLDEKEILEPPGTWSPGPGGGVEGGESAPVDTSPELALALLALFTLELGWRLLAEARRKRQTARALGESPA